MWESWKLLERYPDSWHWTCPVELNARPPVLLPAARHGASHWPLPLKLKTAQKRKVYGGLQDLTICGDKSHSSLFGAWSTCFHQPTRWVIATGFLNCHFNDILFLSQHLELCVSIYLRSYHIKYATFAFCLVRSMNSVMLIYSASRLPSMAHRQLLVCDCVHDGGNLICAAVKLVCGLHCILTDHGRYERRILIHLILYDKFIQLDVGM